nr:hypothetical protein [Tanacetum cinerariifolium]
HFALDDSLRDTSSSPSSSFSLDTSSDSPLDDLSDSSYDQSLPAPSSGPSCKRSRSPAASVSLSSPIPRALSSARADLLPSPKSIRSSDYVMDLEDSSPESSEPSRTMPKTRSEATMTREVVNEQIDRRLCHTPKWGLDEYVSEGVTSSYFEHKARENDH